MRQTLTILFVALLVALSGCKQKPVKKAPAPKAAGAAEEAAPAAGADKKPVEEPVAPATAPEADAAEEVVEGEGSAPSATTETPPTVPMGEIPKPDPFCQEKLRREDERVREEVLPILEAEARAIDVLVEWTEATYALLEEREGTRLVELSRELGEKHETCSQDLSAALKAFMAPPKEGSGGRFSPNARPFDNTLAENYNGVFRRIPHIRELYPLLLKLATQPEQIRSLCQRTFPWQMSGGGQADPAAQWTEFARSTARCRAYVDAQECSAEGFLGALKQAEAEMQSLCEAAQAGLRGERCGGRFPEGSAACDVLTVAAAEDRFSACDKLEEQMRSPLPMLFCLNMGQFEKLDCAAAAALTLEEITPVMVRSCALSLLVRSGAEECGEALPADSAECALLEAFVSTREGSKMGAVDVAASPAPRPDHWLLLAFQNSGYRFLEAGEAIVNPPPPKMQGPGGVGSDGMKGPGGEEIKLDPNGPMKDGKLPPPIKDDRGPVQAAGLQGGQFMGFGRGQGQGGNQGFAGLPQHPQQGFKVSSGVDIGPPPEEPTNGPKPMDQHDPSAGKKSTIPYSEALPEALMEDSIRFILAALSAIPAKADEAEGMRPCHTLYTETAFLPNRLGGSDLLITALNPVLYDAECRFKMAVFNDDSRTEKTVRETIKAGDWKVVSETFPLEGDAKTEVQVSCRWLPGSMEAPAVSSEAPAATPEK